MVAFLGKLVKRMNAKGEEHFKATASSNKSRVKFRGSQ
jgi:hypothetical protein